MPQYLNRHPLLRTSIALYAAGLLPAAALAQSGAGIDEIVITASRTEQPLSQIPNTVTVIGQEDLLQQTSITPDLSTILGNMIPSFSPSRQKMTSYGESLRGRDPLYMVDGVPQSNPLRDGSRDSYTIDPLMLERVEVIHGANAIHGLGASGGIINLITRDPDDGLRQNLRVESIFQEEDLGESIGYGANYSLSGGSGPWDGLASVGYRSSGVGYDADGRVVGFDSAQGDTMDSDMRNLFLKGGYDWNDQRLELTLNRFEIEGNNNWVPVNGDLNAGIPTTSVKGDVAGLPPTNEVDMLSLQYSNEAVLGHRVRLQGFLQEFAATYGGGSFATFQDPAYGATVFDQSQNNSEKQGLKLTLLRDSVGGLPLDLVYGMDYLEDQTWQELALTGRKWVPETQYENIAFFLQGEYAGIRNLVLTTGLRHEISDLTVDDFTTLYSYNGGQSVAGGKPDFSETLFNLGATYQLTEGLRFFGNYSEGFSMPDVGRVLRGIDAPGQDVETFLDLTPIITKNLEAGIEYGGEAFSAQLSWYSSESDFGQRLQANADGIYTVQREKTEIDGIELRGQWFVTSQDILGLRYAHTGGEYDADADGSVDTELSGANMSPDRLNLSWDHTWTARVNTRLQLSHVIGRDFEDAAGAKYQDFDGYTTLDLSTSIGIGGGTLRLSAQNLTNEDYFTYYSQTLGSDSRNFQGFGRSINMSYLYSFR